MQVNEMMVALGIPIGSMALAAVIVGLVGYFKNQERRQRHETIRLALEKGQPVPPELLDDELALAKQALGSGGRRRDLAKGIQWIFTGVGLSLFLWIFRPEHSLWAVGLILIFIGLGKLVAHAVTRGQDAPAPGGPAA